jgi:integrase
MGRSQDHTMKVGDHVAGRPRPWPVRWKANLKNGERIRRVKFFATEAEAIEFKAKHEAIAATMLPPPPKAKVPPNEMTAGALQMAAANAVRGTLTLRTFATDWLATHVARRRPSVRRSYAGLLETHVYETLGDQILSPETFGPQHVIAMLSIRANAGVTWGTQKAIIGALSSCLSWAVRYDHLDKNPCAKLKKELKDSSSNEYNEPEPNPINEAEYDAFLHWLKTGRVPGKPADHPLDGPRLRGGQLRTEGYPLWHPHFVVLGGTGMRRGEAAALKDTMLFLDRDEPFIRVERSYSPSAAKAARDEGKVSDGNISPKAGRYRDVEIGPDLVEVLRENVRTKREKAFARGRKAAQYTFVTERGTRILSDSKTADRIFDRFFNGYTTDDGRDVAALLPPHFACREGCTETHAPHTIHDLRDTFATIHLMKDPRSLYWVSSQLGHRDLSTTTRRYSKYTKQKGTINYARVLDEAKKGSAGFLQISATESATDQRVEPRK